MKKNKSFVPTGELRYLTPEEMREMKGRGGYLPKPKRRYPIEEIRELREQGLSIRKIAEKLKISKSTTHRLLSQNRRSSPC